MNGFDMPGTDASYKKRSGWLVRRLEVYFDLTPEQAAGIVGNLGYESAGFKTLQEIAPAVEGSRGGYGWAQWTGPRRRAFEAWCVENGFAFSSDEGNYSFLIHELSGSHKSTITALKKTATLDDAVFSAGLTYERPGGTTSTHLPGFSGRMRYAERALDGAYGGEGPAPSDGIRSVVERIKAIQQVLAEDGLYAGAIDGIYGNGSAAAMNALSRQQAREEASQ